MSAFNPLELVRRAGSAGEADVDLAGVALALAALDHPEVELASYHAHLAEIAGAMREAIARKQTPAMAARELMAVRLGYCGDVDTYDDMANADLISVIDRRKGLPVTLGILYMHALRAIRLQVFGLSLPGHFLVGFEIGGERLALDAFNGGRIVAEAEQLEIARRVSGLKAEAAARVDWRVSDREVLVRLLNNIRLRAREQGDAERLAQISERMVLLEADDAELWFDLGVGYAACERPAAAQGALARALELGRGAPWIPEARLLADKLKRQLN